MIYTDPADHRTRAALLGSYLGTALSAMQKAIPMAPDSGTKAQLTEAAAVIAYQASRAEADYAEIRRADLAAAALES